MLFNSRSVSFLLAAFVGVITSFFLSVLKETTLTITVVGFFVAFSTTFILSFLVLEMLIFKELRRIYQLFDSMSGHKLKLHQDANIPIKKISKGLSTFAYAKQQEIDKLKQLEEIRRSFLADISHELKTPIFSAQGFIHTLLDGAVEDKKVRTRFLKKAAKSMDDLENLVQDLMIITQVETGEVQMEMEDFNLNMLIEEVLDDLERKAKKRDTKLVLDNDNSNYDVNADRYRIRQVISNLVENAIKYGKEKGNVQVQLIDNAESVVLKICDDGPGIPEEHWPKVFQRFYRVDKSRSREKGGTGLGLSIVKHILEAHGSTIKLERNPEKGATFVFELKKSITLEENSPIEHPA
ncbi:MAG: sensor histidine kinase [Cyclobacteriaceae bacterium]